MISFESDYIEGAHPLILEALAKSNMESLSGYGSDKYTERAKEKIAAACGLPETQVFFLTGGTQIVIDTMLAQYEGVVSAQTGHVSVHEAGAIEYTGRKVLTIPAHNGKMDSKELDSFINDFYADGNHEHMVFPGLCYISHPTEYGTLYSKEELTQISEVCHKHKIPLFMPAHFDHLVKKHGALLAKGRLLGVQFDTLFTDDLYFKISRNAIERAEELKSAFSEKGYKFFIDSPTNQQFVILENSKMQKLQKSVKFSFWEKYDENHTVVRFATSWATTSEKISELRSVL